MLTEIASTGFVPAAAKPAAKFGLGFWGLNDDVIPIYEDECKKLGREPGQVLHTSVGVHVAEDTDKGNA